MPIKFKSSNINKFIDKWKKKEVRLKDLEPAHKQVSIYLDQWVQRNFQKEGAVLSTGKWKPFALGGRYVPGQGIDTSARLLQDTGDLRKSFLPFYNKKNAGIGSELFYAKKHEEGDDETNLPARRMLPLQKEVKEKVGDILTEYGREVLLKDD
jgi:phage gpG-like protein